MAGYSTDAQMNSNVSNDEIVIGLSEVTLNTTSKLRLPQRTPSNTLKKTYELPEGNHILLSFNK